MDMLSKISDKELYDQLKCVLSPYFKMDPDYDYAEIQFNRVVTQLTDADHSLAGDILNAYYEKIAADTRFAYALGYQTNLNHFKAPSLPPFFQEDPSTYLREYIMFRMPAHLEAEQKIQKVLHSTDEIFFCNYFQPIAEYFSFYVTFAPKYAHLKGFLDANDLLSFIVPGYIKDIVFTSQYCTAFSNLYNFKL